jgi:hypothetical protein
VNHGMTWGSRSIYRGPDGRRMEESVNTENEKEQREKRKACAFSSIVTWTEYGNFNQDYVFFS